jgi:hypothetical protein
VPVLMQAPPTASLQGRSSWRLQCATSTRPQGSRLVSLGIGDCDRLSGQVLLAGAGDAGLTGERSSNSPAHRRMLLSIIAEVATGSGSRGRTGGPNVCRGYGSAHTGCSSRSSATWEPALPFGGHYQLVIEAVMMWWRSSSPTSLGAIARSRCCFMAPSTSVGMSSSP